MIQLFVHDSFSRMNGNFYNYLVSIIKYFKQQQKKALLRCSVRRQD